MNELQKEFRDKFITGIDYKIFPLVTDIWDWFEPKLPKEVEPDYDRYATFYYAECPECQGLIYYSLGSDCDKFCSHCGSKLKWK